MGSIGADSQITDLTLDDHACLTFGEREEYLDLTAAYIRDGLAEGLRVVWLSEEPQAAYAELDRRGLGLRHAGESGRMRIVAWQDGLLSGRQFALEDAMRWLRAQRDEAEQTHRGLRVAIDMGWALGPVQGVEQLPAFERQLAETLAGTRVSVLCQYDRERFDPVTLASVSAFHTRSVAAATYHDDPLLRICRQYAPPGIRLAGQIDSTAEESLALALAEVIRGDADVIVNMTELTFIDVACTRMILDCARSICPDRKVVLRCHPTISARFVLLGATDIAGVTVETADER